jgi:TrmH family RNA methyltransferase
VISSTANPRVRWIRRLQASRRDREREGLFVIEGQRMVREAVAARVAARLVLHNGRLGPEGRALMNGMARLGAEVEEGSPAVLAACSETQTPPGLLAVLERPRLGWPDAPGFLVVLDRVADPGNLGAVLRTARAAGVEGALLLEGTVDPYNPKVVRAGMGAHFALPIRQVSLREAVGLLGGLNLYVADAREGVRYDQASWREPLALVIGGEAQGASPDWRSARAQAVHVPMATGTESLNTAVATGILLYEIRRRRGSP